MLYQKRNYLPFLQSQLLLDHGIDKHAFFLKSERPMSFDNKHIETASAHVQTLFQLSSLVYVTQVHGTHIERVQEPIKCEADGMITDKKNIGLLVRHADCQAALIVEPQKKVALALHVGWRALVAGFFEKAFKKLAAEYQIEPSDCLVALSPSLGPCHAEFKGHEAYFPASFLPMMVKPNYFDLWSVAKTQLIKLGVKKKSIDIAKMCTYAHGQACYSYRRGDKLRRMGSFVALT